MNDCLGAGNWVLVLRQIGTFQLYLPQGKHKVVRWLPAWLGGNKNSVDGSFGAENSYSYISYFLHLEWTFDNAK